MAATAKKNLFTATSTRTVQHHRQNVSAPTTDPNSVAHDTWLASQRQAVASYRASLHRCFLQRHEAAVHSLSESQRRASVFMLVNEAARYHRALELRGCLDADTSSFTRAWWKHFALQVQAVCESHCSSPHEKESGTCDPLQPSQRALENISSLGVWFTGPDVSLPMRKYAMLTLSHHTEDGVAVYQPVVVTGVCQFGYSNYIMEIRSLQQRAVLHHLEEAQP